MAKKGPAKIPLIEWLSALFGAAVLVGMIAFLVREGLREREDAPPLLTAQPVRLASAGAQFVIEVDVRNASRHTGASVQVEGQLNRGNSAVETSSATLSYVPGESHRRAGLIFTHDPRNYALNIRVTGYERP